MKRWIHASEDAIQTGFFFVLGDKGIFLRSKSKNLTNTIVRDVINVVCDLKGVGDHIRQAALYNTATLKDFKRRISKATLEKKDNGEVEYYSITDPNGTSNWPVEDFERSFIVRDARE